MSHASAQVRFPDGTVLHAEYNGTSDTIGCGNLYGTFAEMWRNWRLGEPASCTCDQLEPVVYWTSYADGWTFPATACRHCLAVVEGDAFEEMAEGVPDWVERPCPE